MNKRPFGRTNLTIAPLVLGGNVFGWTVDQKTGFDILDAFVDAGFGALDTSDYYSRYVAGHSGGESETMIGNWLATNPGKRAKVTIMTKVGMDMGSHQKGLSRRWIVQAVEASLRRLQTDVIDVYQSHQFDPHTPQDETLEAYRGLLSAGKVRAIGCSNFDSNQLADALRIAREQGLPPYQTLQPLYNLYDRAAFEGALRDLTVEEGMGVISYYSLAAGFLTGKYRSAVDLGKSARSRAVGKYLNPRGFTILSALDRVADRHRAEPAAVALAWLMARKGVTAAIASATNLVQLQSLIRATTLTLSTDDVADLDAGSAVQGPLL